MKKLKQFSIKIAKNFPTTHPNRGQPTNFKEQILDGVKIHTGRANYGYWLNIVNQVNNGLGVLNLQQWSGVPYYSSPETFKTLTKLGIQQFDIDPVGLIMLDNSYGKLINVDEQYRTIAKNDGLSLDDFISWFDIGKKEFDGGLIHFTDFRY